MAEKIMQARESFSVTLPDGTPFVVAAGERYAVDDFVVRGREHLFEEQTVRSSGARSTGPDRASPDTETADQSPGSRRSVGRARGSVSTPDDDTAAGKAAKPAGKASDA